MYNILPKTLFIGKRIYFLPTCQSTNSIANQLISENKAEEGLVVITSEQTAGRGQRGSNWESHPNKNLTFSLVLRPSFLTPLNLFDLNVIASLAVFTVLKELVSSIKIKWPNDIYFQKEKISGILIENILKGNLIQYTVIGIGLNVNQREFNHPIATSLSRITGSDHNLEELLSKTLEYIEVFYLKLKSGMRTELYSEYNNALYLREVDHLFETDEDTFSGNIFGVTPEGKLLINSVNGIRSFSFKEVRFT